MSELSDRSASSTLETPQASGEFLERAERLGNVVNSLRHAARQGNLPHDVQAFEDTFLNKADLSVSEHRLCTELYREYLGIHEQMISRYNERKSDKELFTHVFGYEPKDALSTEMTDLSIVFHLSARDYNKMGGESSSARHFPFEDPHIKDESLRGYIVATNGKPEGLYDQFLTWLMIKVVEDPPKDLLTHTREQNVRHEDEHALFGILKNKIDSTFARFNSRKLGTMDSIEETFGDVKRKVTAFMHERGTARTDRTELTEVERQAIADLIYPLLGRLIYSFWASEILCQFTDGKSQGYVEKVMKENYSHFMRGAIRPLMHHLGIGSKQNADDIYSLVETSMNEVKVQAERALYALEQSGVGDREYIASIMMFTPFPEWKDFSGRLLQKKGKRA